MARLFFPNNPTLNQEISLGNTTFFWDGRRWKRKPKVIEVPTALSELAIDNKATTQQAEAGTDNSSLMTPLSTKSAIDLAISNILDSTPTTLDTLNELAAALGDDPNFATTVSNQIGTKADKTMTLSAGTGLIGGGDLSANRTISHADTSSQGSINNSDGTIIQDVTLDAFGHVTGLGSVNLDSRYYTESEVNSLLGGKLSTTGGTLTGPLTMSDAGDPIYANRIGGRGTEIYIGAGESLSEISGTAEQVYIAGESGVSVHASSDNLASGLNRSAQLIDTSGNASWGSGSITAGTFIGSLNGTASNANTLDGIDSSQFLRSDATDTMSGRLEMANTIDMNNYDIAGVDQIFHHGDTDTYMQFHAADQWRVVTGNSERLEVNNSAVTISNKLVGKINEVNNNVGINFWTGTQAEYDAIATKSSTTVYLVKE